MRNEELPLSMNVSATGGTITRLQWNERHLFYPEQMLSVNGVLKRRGGNPILLPYASKPPAKIPSYKEAPQHGWLRDMPLGLYKTFRTVGSNFYLQQQTMYPWSLECRLTHKIIDDYSFKTEIAVRREKDGRDGNAPLNPGLHSYFNKPGRCLIYVGDEEIHIDGKGEFPAEIFSARSPIIIDSESVGTIVMRLAGDYSDDSVIIIWSDMQEKYICVEPILMPIHTYLDEEKGVFLKERESLTISYTLSFSQHSSFR